MREIQNILDAILPFIENLLKEYGEFFPLAVALKINDELFHLETFDGGDFAESTDVIETFIKELVAIKEDIKLCCIFYDVRLDDEEVDAVAVFVESKESPISFTFYQPYEIKQGEVVFSEPWKVEKELQIFVK